MSETNGNGVQGLTEGIVDELRKFAQSEAVIGEPIVATDGTVAIPVSRVSVGFGSGGVDFPSRQNKSETNFTGGGMGGAAITPIAFLVLSPTGGVSLLQLADRGQLYDRILNVLPGMVQQVSDFISEQRGVPGKKKTEKRREKAERRKNEARNKAREVNVDIPLEFDENQVTFDDAGFDGADLPINDFVRNEEEATKGDESTENK